MHRFIAALCASVFLALTIPAGATDRVVTFPQENPTSLNANQQLRSDRLVLGTWMMQELNLTGNISGIYSGLTTSPATGLFVTVGPTTASTLGALYQVAQNDPDPIPASCPVGPTCAQLAADQTLIAIPALQALASNPIGPLTAPGSGLSVYWLIEAQVQTIDTNSQVQNFVSASGPTVQYVVNNTRTDEIVYVAKGGSPASSSPTHPTPDSGFIPIAYVLVPNGMTQVPTNAITAAPAFAGFAPIGSQIALVQGTPTPQTGNGAITGQFSAGSFSGNGSLLTNINPANFSSVVPISLGGTGTPAPNGVLCGISNNLTCTGSFPSQTVDLASSPTLASASIGTLNTASIVPSPSSSPITVTAPGLLVDTIQVQPGAVATSTPCPSGSACVGGNVYVGALAGSAGDCLQLGSNGQVTATVAACGLASSPINSISPGPNVYIGGTSSNPVVGVTAAPSFPGGIGVDGQTAPANGIQGGTSSGSPLILNSLFSGTGYSLNLGASTCATAGIARFSNSGTTEAAVNCSGVYLGTGFYGIASTIVSAGGQCEFCYGQPGIASHHVVGMGNDRVSTCSYSSFGAADDGSVAGVQNDLWSLTYTDICNSGNDHYMAGIDTNFNIGFRNNVYAVGAVVAGQTTATTAPSPTPGALVSTTGTGKGDVLLGSNGNFAKCDYGETTSSTLTCNAPLTVIGPVSAIPTASASPAPVPPCYHASSTPCALTFHIVTGSTSLNTSGSCANGAICGGSATITFSGVAAPFTSLTYSCHATNTNVILGVGAVPIIPESPSSTTITFVAQNLTGSSISGGTNIPFYYVCLGT